MIFTGQTIKPQKQQAPLVQLLSVKVYWQIKCHQRGQLTQELQPETISLFLVGPIRVVGGLVEFSQVAIRPLYRIQHRQAKGQSGLVLFSGKPSLVVPLFSFLSHSQVTICFSSQTSVTRVRLHKTSVLNQEYLKWRDQESSRNENRWIICGLWTRLLNQLLVSLEFHVALIRCT